MRQDWVSGRLHAVGIGLVALLGLGGCTSLPPVQPWEKGVLARPAMTFEYEPVDAMYAEHIYSSKEAASGGTGVSGGGCGCN